MDTVQSAFDKAYWASQPAELQTLPAIEDFNQRSLRAAALATQGFIVDVPIMVWGWDPYLVMTMRADYGYTWVPSALQPNISVAPGVTQPGAVPYDPAHPPTGSIKVSTNIADYPPLDPPVSTPQLPTSGNPVGPQSLGTLYLSVAGDSYPDGAKFTDSRGTFLKHVTFTPFGRTNYWEKVA
jgi:hypothetical protein